MVRCIQIKREGATKIEIKTSEELRKAVKEAIQESGLKNQWIADQMGLTKQGFLSYMKKKNFTLEDANKVLEFIGKEVVAKVNKKSLPK